MWVLKVKVISWPWPKVIYIWKFLRNDWAILNQILFCAWPNIRWAFHRTIGPLVSGNEDTQQVWTEFEFWPDGTKGCRVIALDRCQKLVFAQYLENGWTEFNQILDTLYYWQDLCCYSKVSFFANLQRGYSPWLMSEIGVCSISWEKMDRIQPNFVYTLSSTRSILVL